MEGVVQAMMKKLDMAKDMMDCLPMKLQLFMVIFVLHYTKSKFKQLLLSSGALDMKLKTVRDAMTPIDQVFMLEVTDTMGERTMDRV